MSSLHVWMNGEYVGEWGALRGGTAVFRYARSWAQSSHARGLSLSLPLTADLEVRGAQVLTGDLSAQRLDNSERLIHSLTRLGQISAVALQPRQIVLSRGFPNRIVAPAAEG